MTRPTRLGSPGSGDRLYAPPHDARGVTVELKLREDDAALQARARRFSDEVLQPLELECEEHDGLTPGSAAAAKQAVLDHGFAAINHTVENGGKGLDTFQVMLVEEQWGRVTNALWDVPWRPSIPLAAGTEEQKQRFLRPACRGERRDAYAITEAGAGSDVTMVETTARRDGDAWVLDGEKWHVTSGDVADFFLVHAHVDGDPARATVFLVDKNTPGVRLVRTPKYTHTFVFEHPIFAFEGVRVTDDRVLGGVGEGFDLTKDWFVEERLMIGARTVGASQRCLDESLAFAAARSPTSRRSARCSPTWRPRSWPRSRSCTASAGRRPAATSIANSSTRRRARSSSSAPRRPAASPTGRSRSSAGAATCASSRSNVTGASSASTGSGREPARSSAWW
jgi:alkylation response protein AidB-like acyl-CoA dehydrogenase